MILFKMKGDLIPSDLPGLKSINKIIRNLPNFYPKYKFNVSFPSNRVLFLEVLKL